MKSENNLNRFIIAQNDVYDRALAEITNGRKESHWMWYIFPQVQGLGFSETSKLYAIKNIEEAEDYLAHPVLGNRLVEISGALLNLKTKNANSIFGSPDDIKLQSCMTLFCSLSNSHSVFQAVLDKFFEGVKDTKTLQIINSENV